MDIITMKLIENKVNIPLDIIRYINEYVKYENLDDNNIKKATLLWFNNRDECIFIYGHISNWKTRNVKNMNKLFKHLPINEDISRWDVSNVIYMSYMFEHSTTTSNISNWNVSNVLYMRGMFFGSSYDGDLSKWNVCEHTDVSYMFYGSSRSNFNFSSWNLGQNTRFEHFCGSSNYNYVCPQPTINYFSDYLSSTINRYNNNFSNKK